MRTLDLNADLGEGFGCWRIGDDAAMLDIVSTANIACGAHAGDPQIMRDTISTARHLGVAVGAHPGYADLAGFGRRAMLGVTASEIENLVAYQIGAFVGLAALAGHPPTHVKTHGALGNACAIDDDLADAVARAIRAVDAGLAFMVMPGMATARAADRAGLKPIHEIYADRTYAPNFNLTPRDRPEAMIHGADAALARIIEVLETKVITATDGSVLPVEIDSICVHGDSVGAVEMATKLRKGLEAKGYVIASGVTG